MVSSRARTYPVVSIAKSTRARAAAPRPHQREHGLMRAGVIRWRRGFKSSPIHLCILAITPRDRQGRMVLLPVQYGK